MVSKSMTVDTQNSEVSFKVKKLGILTVVGTITDLTGEVLFDKNALDKASFHVCLGPVTIDTGNTRRDEHLKSEDFFFVKEYPKICFQSTSIQKANNSFRAIGKLSVLGETNEVGIPFTVSEGVFEGTFSLNRLDYKLGKKFPTWFVGKSIQITISCKIQ
jgi:polyisoprenoid-binding protein YceI